MNRSIASFEELIDRYADYLSGKGIQFNPQGFPMLQPQMYLDEWPELMVPYRDRKARFVHNPSHTVLCLFTSDMRIYPRLEKALDDIPEYSRYMGAVGSDLTVTSDMDLEWQQAIMLLNQLYLATLAVNGVKIVQNLRCGSPSTITCLSCVPSGVMCATSTLGCANTESELDRLFAGKLFAIRPGKLLLYGKHDPIMERQANVAGVPCRIYPDAHTLYKQLARTCRTLWKNSSFAPCRDTAMPPCSCHSSLAASDEPADLWRYCQQVDRVRGGGEQDPPVGPAQWAVWFTFTPMWWSSALNASGSFASVTETFIDAPCMSV